MMTWQAWTVTGEQIILQGHSSGEIMDKANVAGCVRVRDGNGCIARKISGEWVWL